MFTLISRRLSLQVGNRRPRPKKEKQATRPVSFYSHLQLDAAQTSPSDHMQPDLWAYPWSHLRQSNA